MDELLGFFDQLINEEGSLTYESVHNDPETIELLGSRKDSDDGPRRVRLYGFTKEISLMQSQIEVAIGKSLPRPTIPGLELRLTRHIEKTKSKVEQAQERSRARKAKRLNGNAGR